MGDKIKGQNENHEISRVRIIAVGCGDCGCRIADQFARLNRKARAERSVDIVVDTYAINTDGAGLAGLQFIDNDDIHRIRLGGQAVGGSGLGGINELGADLMKANGDSILSALVATPRFSEAACLLLITSAAGGTGSPAAAILAQRIKEHYLPKPVYVLAVTPAELEEKTGKRTVINTAMFLKSIYLVADAVFLFDNQRFAIKDPAVTSIFPEINRQIVYSFYNMLCAGEARSAKDIGLKVLDTGDIIQTLSGWTVVGLGRIRSRSGGSTGRDFRDRGDLLSKGMNAMAASLNGLSTKCDPRDAKRALYVVTGPGEEVSMDLLKEMGSLLKQAAPEATIRSGDYPQEGQPVEVTIVLSDLVAMSKVNVFFDKAIDIIAVQQKARGLGRRTNPQEAFADIPLLLAR